MSIRLRLTLLYSTILAVTLTGFSMASYVTVARDGYQRLVDTLASKAQRITADTRFQLDDIDALAHQFAGPEVYVQTRNASGDVVDRSPNLGEMQLPLNASDATADDGARVDIALIGGERRLVYSQPHAAGLLQISNSLTDRDRSLNNLLRVLVAGNILVILAAFGTGWLVAGIGLRPIFRLAQAVLAIGRTRDFARRVRYTGADDEIGQLAATFDQMLNALEDAHRQTERALQAQRRFVADASHELRTPLTTIRGNLDLLRREPPIRDSDRLTVLTDLAEETDRLIRMVNDMLVLARADVQAPAWQEPVPLQPVLDHVQRQMTQLAPARAVRFDPVDGDNAMPLTALGNEDALKQVLLILLDNAVKHTPPSAQIAVRAGLLDGDGPNHNRTNGAYAAPQVEICVCDTGAGIPQDELPRIFDRFYVVDTARAHNSTGLGLAIAKTLVESQHGQIAVASSRESGTTFQVILPCQTAN